MLEPFREIFTRSQNSNLLLHHNTDLSPPLTTIWCRPSPWTTPGLLLSLSDNHHHAGHCRSHCLANLNLLLFVFLSTITDFKAKTSSYSLTDSEIHRTTQSTHLQQYPPLRRYFLTASSLTPSSSFSLLCRLVCEHVNAKSSSSFYLELTYVISHLPKTLAT